MKNDIIGKPIDRVDGRLKVTGAAKYAAEFGMNNIAYAFPVRSTIGNGTITNIDTSAAEKAGGVLAVLTHKNAPRLKELNWQEIVKTGGIPGELLLPIQDNKIHYWGQYIGLVVAETYEQARTAAELVKVDYAKETLAIDLEKELPKGFKPEKFLGLIDVQINIGNAGNAVKSAPAKIEQTYSTRTENHHPIEPSASIAFWTGDDKLTIFDSTQGVKRAQGVAAYILELMPENVQIFSPYVGGGFGCKGFQWMHPILAAMAARNVKRPVKLVLTRQMMQTNVGRRGATIQKVSLASDKSGKLSAIRHLIDTYTSNVSEFIEPSGVTTMVSYAAPNREITHTAARLNIGTPTIMRAPGEASGSFALESAMDEMAHELKIDPIQFRLINHADIDPIKNLPFSSKYLKECYRIGAEKFGWNKRNIKPRQVRNGKYLVGHGMATATYPAYRNQASAKVQMMANGAVKVMSAATDIGTGTYTILAQTAAESLGVPVERVKVELGDSFLPNAPSSGASQITASVNPAVLAAAGMLRKDLLALAIADGKSKLNGRKPEEIEFADGKFFVKNDISKSDSYVEIMRRNNKTSLETCATSRPASGGNSAPCQIAEFSKDENYDVAKYSFHSFGSQFAEVWVDEDLGRIRVKRFTSVIDAGTIMNDKTARSQIIGGVVWGIGQALMEETEYDKRWANPVTRTLADYHVPCNLDVPPIEVFFIGKPDPHISPIGARGIGEIGITGVAAAIANAVFNAMGKRLRDLPLTPDKLI